MRCAPFAVAALAAATTFAVPGVASADSGPPGNLGNGLSRLVSPPASKSGIRLTQAPLAIRDRAGRVLVDVGVAEASSLATVQSRTAAAGLKVVTRDTGT